MSALDPSGDAQPTLSQAYTTPGNPAESDPVEKAQKKVQQNDDSKPTDTRVPQTQSSSTQDATPSSLGRGITGSAPGEESKGLTDQDVGRHKELDAQQMAAPGEGDVANAVAGRDGAHGALSGGGGKEQDFVSDLDRKKEEQRGKREEIMGARKEGVQDGGVGQQGGPASTVQ